MIKSEIDKANGELARVEQIKAFRILPKVLDPEEEGEPVTPTRKVKRKLMYERFKPLVESMYDDREERLIAAGSRRRSALEDIARNATGRKTMLKGIVARALWPAAAIALPAAAQDAYVVGLTGALTGPPASTYAPAVEALRIYIERVNAAGGVNGKKIKLIMQDDSARSRRRPPPTPRSSSRRTTSC